MTLERDEYVGRWRIMLDCQLWWHHGTQWTWLVEKRWNRIVEPGQYHGREQSWNFPGLDKKKEATKHFEEVVHDTTVEEALAVLGLST